MREKNLLLRLTVILMIGFAFVFKVDFSLAKDMTAKDLVDEAKKSVVSISVDKAKAMLGKSGVIFLDVREPKEYKAGHVPNAINIPRGLIEFKVTSKIPDKAAQIIIYCKSGGRACLTAFNLTRMGYTNIKNIDGGWQAWSRKGYPVE
jgi:rhodanese-related sulfurtransferase